MSKKICLFITAINYFLVSITRRKKLVLVNVTEKICKLVLAYYKHCFLVTFSNLTVHLDFIAAFVSFKRETS